MSTIMMEIPVVPLKGLCILPGMTIHFDISQKIKVAAVEAAMIKDQRILLITQKDGSIELPKEEDLYEYGVIAEIKQIIKLPGNIIRVMVRATKRAKLDEVIRFEPYMVGEGTVYDLQDKTISENEEIAMTRNIKELVVIYSSENPRVGKEIAGQLLEINSIEELIYQTAINIPLPVVEKQRLIASLDLEEQYQIISEVLTNEIQIIGIRKEIQSKVKEKLDQNQKEYILREQLKVIREELGEDDTLSEAEKYLEELAKISASDFVKEKIEKEIERFKSTASNPSESTVVRGYVETLLSMPWDNVQKDNEDIKYAKKVLDEDHYGLVKVKERILEFLAVRTLSKKGDTPIICLVGPPGTGKTSIARSVAKALNKKYVRICLGGVRDEAEIRGHRRTYVGAMSGRIATGLKNAGVKNPLMLLDEIDKVGSDQRGDTSSALLEVLDMEQNNKFVDHYIEIPIDLSEVLFIATANSLQTIAKPLLDRMEIIEVTSYTGNEKFHIAKEHLIAKQKSKNGISNKQLSISPKAIQKIITGYTKEAGVRNLERKFGEICRKAAREIIEENKESVKVNDKNLEKYLGKIKYTFDMANAEDEIGIVRGLAWTSVGGDTLQIEVNVMLGKGNIELTGQLGDVMKESAKAGISYIRSVADNHKIPKTFFEKNDFHIHIPEGAVPKDGPSAGITMATAIISAITKKKVRADVAMTGEITLRGRVLPIGGLKEKILAAKTAQIKTVIVPNGNKKDIEEISREILDGIEIEFVQSMENVLEIALVKEN